MRSFALVSAVVAALTLSAASSGSTTTTVPSTRVTVQVQLTDKGVRVFTWVAIGGAESNYLQALQTPVPRGDSMTFVVTNSGKKPHNFTILGKKTPPIRPGKKAGFALTALKRGRFLYRSTLDKGKAFSGYLAID